jgi:subfamily B ATP-binding cassette protein MsbA
MVIGALSSLSEGIGIALFIPILGKLQTGVGDDTLPMAFEWLLPNPVRHGVDWLAIVVLGLVVLKNLLLYANAALLAWIDSVSGHELRRRIFDSLMNAPMCFWDRRDPGKVLDTLANESWRTAQAFQVLSGSVVHACTVVVFTGLLLAISWKLTALVLCGLGLISASIRVGMRPVKAVGEEAVRVNAELGAHMWDGIAGIRSIHAFSLQLLKQQRFRNISQQVRRSFFRLELLSGLVPPVSEVLHAGLLLAVLLWLLPHGTSAPTALVFLVLLFRLQPNVSKFQASWVALTGMAGSIQDVGGLLDSAGEHTPAEAGVAYNGLKEALSFDAVTFQYDGESRPALADVSARIPAGKVTAVVGPSGAGKTTLIHLICRFYDVEAGAILVDGLPLPSVNLKSWRQSIGLASQETHLFSATIRENIAFGSYSATDAQIAEAAIRAGAHEFILQLPEGYDTRVGERGIRLSGGQRQRIALARAFVRNPEILLLDEATNALDSVTEEAVSRSLCGMEGKRTIIIVAHRLATISMAHHVIVLDEGRVAQQGTPAELTRAGGLFANLFRVDRPVSPESRQICDTY